MTEFVRFGFVGCLAAATHVLMFFANSRGPDLHPAVATEIAFVWAGGVFSGVNRTWKFRVAADHQQHLPRFLAMRSRLRSPERRHHASRRRGLRMVAVVCLLIAVAILTELSFGLQRQWGFR